MTSPYLFLLVYLLASCRESSSVQRNGTCITQNNCAQVPDPTLNFLQCVGLPSADTGKDHMLRLKGMIEASLDVYTFMRSSMSGVPILNLEAAMVLNPGVEAFQDQALIQMWLEVKIKPLLSSITKQFLSCLSTKNFSCATYQTVVKELSLHFSEMNPVRQKWIYTFFMYPFLSGKGVAGCVKPEEGSEEWLMRNFGSFSAMARMNDFSTLNMLFSGLEVLHLLSPEQKAELLLRPEVAGLDNSTLSLVFHSLMTGDKGPRPTTTPGESHNWTSPGYPYTYLPRPTYDPYSPPSPQDSLREVVKGFMGAFRPIGSLVSEFVSLTHKRNVSEIRGTTLAQALLNWTLAELASIYRPHNASLTPEREKFDVTDVEDWYDHVVMPVLRRFLTEEQAQLPENITATFHHIFYLDFGTGNDTSELQDTCSITLEERSCGLTNAVENVAHVLQCFAHSNLTISEETILRMVVELTGRLNSLVKEFSTANFTEVASNFREIFGQVDSPSLTRENLEDPHFIKLWFQIKLLPLLPTVPTSLLSCLSTKKFTCHVYQTLVAELSKHMRLMDRAQMYSHSIYEHFIYAFLLHHNTSDPQCVSSANHSAEWLENNFGFFSMFASVKDFYDLNQNFSGLESLRLLSPKQTAEMLVLPLRTPPEKEVVIHRVLDFLTESPEERRFPEFLSHLVMFSEEGNISCSSYKILFTRLDQAMPIVPLGIAASITNSKLALSKHIPPGCIIYSGECNVTPANETDICVQVNSTVLQLHLDNRQMNGRFCDFGIEEYACASLSELRAEDLAAVLKCNRSSNSSGSRPVWKVFLSKASVVLDAALDLLANMTFDPSDPAISLILDSIREIRLDTFTMSNLQDPAFIQLWFNRRLHPFLPAVSTDFLSCLSTRNLSCSTYQAIVQILSRHQSNMKLSRQISVYTHFIKAFLSRNHTADPSCSLHNPNSGEWLEKNLRGFSALVSFHDLQRLYSNFSVMEALPQLTVRQLAEVSSTPGQLTSPAQVTMVMDHVPDQLFTVFFDDFSSAVMGHESLIPSEVRSAMLQVVFDRANLSSPSVSDPEAIGWLHNRLRPLLVGLLPRHVAPIFAIVAGRNCSTEQQAVVVLNSTLSMLQEVTQREIHSHIIQSLREPRPLRCYGDNYNHSFYGFLERSFMGFQFPNLTTFLSLMPDNKMHQLVNSMPPSDLGDFFRRPGVVNDNTQLCQIYTNYIQTPVFLETEALPEVVRRPTLPCIWPMALNSSERSEVNAWFDRRLPDYVIFLTNSLLTSTATHNASCLAFQKLVSVLGKHNYSAADFVERDVYSTIKAYLTSATVPKCYNANNPELNSTAWFAEYIGPFLSFLTIEDLNTFGSAQFIQVFTVNPLNIALLSHSVLPLNLTNYYTELVYQQDSNFNPLLLPLLYRCVAPGSAFSQLTAAESIGVLHNLTTHCTDLDPQVAAALAGNLGDLIDATTIAALGNESTGMSTGQINMAKPEDLYAALGILSTVTGWNQGQAMAIIQSLLSSGMMQINNASSLYMLGSLVVGIPVSTFLSISGSQLLTASQNPAFLAHMMTASKIIQQTFVTQIISVSNSSDSIIQNVPDEMATEIPRSLLLGFSQTKTSIISNLNKKKWKLEQAELFFDIVAGETGTSALGSPNNLSSYVLQGFTCTRVMTLPRQHIKKLIKACRRKGKDKVILQETQLTCMYNYIKGESDATSYQLYPPDMLLYYDYSLVPQASCRSYFEELGDADFSVVSTALSYKLSTLFNNARSCLGISTTSFTEDNVSVLGNMCCTLDRSYIENSHPSILEKLKNCPDLTDAQVAAIETLLLGGTTTYGAPSTWNRQTLEDLGMLPLYLTDTFYNNFDKKTKKTFLKSFLRVLELNGVERVKRREMKKATKKSMKKLSKRSIATECTAGQITQVTISDETFPLDYDDVTQFNCCLSVKTVKDNLAAITAKVDQEDFLIIVLNKLREAYAAYSTIPEQQVQILGPASREATNDDINMWNITKIDTLSALMDSSDGQWDPSMAKAIISKYLSEEGNKLGSAELNFIGGTNLCSLDASVLNTISHDSLRKANALIVSNCTLEKKRVLFIIAEGAMSEKARSTVTPTTYLLIRTYLGGANIDYIRKLAASNISMDMATFISLDEGVIQALSVDEVRDLLGSNLPDLKSYENQTVVQNWISKQSQSDLNQLELNLIGGKVATTAGTSSSSSPTMAESTITVTTSSTTGNGGQHIRADTGISLFLLLALFITSQHILQ